MYEEKYPWETRRDADILKEHAQLAADPARLDRAREYLKDEVKMSKNALDGAPPPISKIDRRSNPATVASLNI